MIEPRRLLPVAAAAGLVLLLHRLYELLVVSPELDLATPSGRVRLVAFAVSRTPGLLLADILLIGAAVTAGTRPWTRRLGWFHGVVAVVFILVLPFFLDAAGRIAPSVGAGELTAFRLLVSRVLILLVAGAAGALLAARSLFGLAAPIAPGSHPLPDP